MEKVQQAAKAETTKFNAYFTQSGVSMEFELPPGQDKMHYFKKECQRMGVEPFAVLS